MHSLWLNEVSAIVAKCNPIVQRLLPWTLLLISSYFLWRSLLRQRNPSTGAHIDGNDQLPTSIKHRKRGEWVPVDFTYPNITPCEQELSEIKPIPYRPFKWGTYHVTMGIRSMPWSEWFELDREYTMYQRIRSHRLRTRGTKALDLLPAKPGLVGSAYEAAIELVHEVAEYLVRRYPTTFRVIRHSPARIAEYTTSPTLKGRMDYGWEGAPPIKTITVLPLGVTYRVPLPIVEDALESVDHGEYGTGSVSYDDETDDAFMKKVAECALTVTALLVQDDIALMIEGKDGRYYFQGGAICIPGFWRMKDKLGLPLEEIHLSGSVPQYAEKLQTSMGRFFEKMGVDKPVSRNNYFIQVVSREEDREEGKVDPEELGWGVTQNGEEDVDREGGLGAKYVKHAVARDMEGETKNGGGPIVEGGTLRLRSERQTLRRLPKSGAIVFGIRTYMTKVEELVEEGEGEVAGRLASAVRGWGDDVHRYKGSVLYKDALLSYLDSKS